MHATFPRAGFIRRSRRPVPTLPLHPDLSESSAQAQLGGIDPIAEDAAEATQDTYTANERALYLQGARDGRVGAFVWGLLIGGLAVAGSFYAGWGAH